MPPPPPRRDAGPGGDAGALDAGPAIDGGGPSEDAGTGDGGPPPSDAGPAECVTSAAERHLLSTDPARGDRVVGFAAGGDAFGVIWAETREGQPDVFGRRVPTRGALGAEQRVTGQPSRELPPSLAAFGTAWLAAWVDNDGSEGFEVRTQQLGADLAPTGTVHRLTATDTLREDNALIHVMGEGPFLLWTEDDMRAGTRTARARTLTADGGARGTIQAVSEAGQRPAQIALGELADGPVAIWTEGIGLEQDVLLQPLTRDGARRGAPVPITAERNADGTVDAALRPTTGGAIVFGVLVEGVRREVRFRAMRADGTLVGSETPLFAPPRRGSDASIAVFAGGYAVAFRGADDGVEGSRVYLYFVDGVGNVLSELDLGPASDAGGRVTVRATGDGHLGVAWADAETDGHAIRVQVIRCGG